MQPKTPDTSVPMAEGPLPFPQSKSELKGGSVYNLPNGHQGRWNGTDFELLN